MLHYSIVGKELLASRKLPRGYTWYRCKVSATKPASQRERADQSQVKNAKFGGVQTEGQ
jgi:hypothetical protein